MTLIVAAPLWLHVRSRNGAASEPAENSRNIVSDQALARRTSRRKAFATLKNRGHYGNQREPADRRNSDRGTPGRARPLRAVSSCDLDRVGRPDPRSDLVRVLPELSARNRGPISRMY